MTEVAKTEPVADDSSADEPAKKASKSARLDATGEAVRRNIRHIRDTQGISGANLSATLKRLGRPIPLVGIQRIESGERRVDVDDLAAIAVALNVSPVTLLMPLRKDDDSDVEVGDLVEIAGWHAPISAGAVWDWLTGRAPLINGTMSLFAQHAWPVWIRREFEERMSQAAAGIMNILNRNKPKSN